MQDLSKNKLEQIAKTRRIKNYKNMAKENLLIAPLKSEQSITELRKSKDNNAKIDKTRKICNEQRNDFKEKTKNKKIKKLGQHFIIEK